MSGIAMATYRIFWVHGAHRSANHVPVDIECIDDEDACKRARQYLDGIAAGWERALGRLRDLVED